MTKTKTGDARENKTRLKVEVLRELSTFVHEVKRRRIKCCHMAEIVAQRQQVQDASKDFRASLRFFSTSATNSSRLGSFVSLIGVCAPRFLCACLGLGKNFASWFANAAISNGLVLITIDSFNFLATARRMCLDIGLFLIRSCSSRNRATFAS